MAKTEILQSGIDAIGPVRWGAHLCHLYRARQEMADTVLPYFIAGLQNNEACLWLTASYSASEARDFLAGADRGLASALGNGQVDVMDAVSAHRRAGVLDQHAILEDHRARQSSALARGRAGLRIAVDLSWLEEADWQSFRRYERDVHLAFASQRTLCLCTYTLASRRTWQLEDVAGCHDLAVNWQRNRLARFAPEVLVVDDEPLIGKMLEFIFEGLGLGVRSARSGKEAVEIYRCHRDAIGVVLLDVQMPGMDGPGTLEALKHINPTVRCCFMSGDTGSYTTRQLLSFGAGHVFSKPFRDIERLKKALWEEIHAGMCE